MAPPAKPKEIKPKEGADGAPKEAGAGGGMDLKFIITLVVVVFSSLIGSAATMYFLAPMVIVPAVIAKLPAPTGEKSDKAEEAKKPAENMNLELEEFTVNLKRDPQTGGSQFVRTKMALSVKVPEEASCAKAEGAKKEGEGKEGAAPAGADPCQVAFNQKMGQFVPSMRDIINASLMKRTADTLDSVEGQESLKDEIKEQINALISQDHYEIARVNFEDFIIQH